MKSPKLNNWLAATWLALWPARPPADVLAWAEAKVRLPGSARSEQFKGSITPWIVEPLRSAADAGTRTVTFVKPVQSGGSVVGEVILCFWISTARGYIQMNWEDDQKCRLRWKRIKPILESCKDIRWPVNRFDSNICEISFPNCFLKVQGVWVPEHLDSETVRYQINEEVHSWEPGHLHKAYNRTSAVWNSKIVNISNAGKKTDQLHRAFMDGTQQVWQVKCPGCGAYHTMRTRWDDRHKELGGLRYDADGCRLGKNEYDYNKLALTVRYQMPCGLGVREDARARRELSLSGRYSEPMNPGAHLSDRSYTLEAVAVDYIPWLKLIKEKHAALRSLKHGDPEPWRRYITERECGFWDPEDRPIVGRIILSERKKDRAGLANRVSRFAALDRQHGELSKGELPYWWLAIRDFDVDGNSLLVFEGRLITDEEVIDTLARHEVLPHCAVADSGHDTMHVYLFCLANGYNSIKGSGEALFSHPDKGRRIFAPEKPLHLMVNQPPRFDYVQTGEEFAPDQREPMFWFYSKSGIRDRLAWLRSGKAVKWEVPSDASDDYQAHMESEELQQQRIGRTNELQNVWVQLKARNDLFVCECYLAMLAEMAGLIGVDAMEENGTRTPEP